MSIILSGDVGLEAGSELIGITSDFFLEVAKGNIAGHSGVRAFGKRDEIDKNNTEDIWVSAIATRIDLAAVETMDLVSNDVNDTAAGTGARTVFISGLDGAYAPISEIIALNGTTTVTTVNSYLRLLEVAVVTVGSGGVNAGDITIIPTVSGASSIQATIMVGDGQSAFTHYTVPAGKTAYAINFLGSIGAKAGNSGEKEGRIKLIIRPFGGSALVRAEVILRSANFNADGFKIPTDIPEKTDLKFTCDSDADDTAVFLNYNLILIDN